MKKYFWLSTVFFTSSCIKVETIHPEVPKYAVICILSPNDSLTTAFISKVNRINEEVKSEDLIVKNALVKIIGKNNTITLKYNSEKQLYEFTNSGFVQNNKKYQLLVEIPNEKQLTSECSINDEIEIFHEENIENDRYKLDVSWKDNPNEYNSYAVSARYFLPNSKQGYLQWNNTSKSFIETNDVSAINGKITINGFIENFSNLKRPFELNILLSNIDKNTNDFFIARNKQYNQNSSLQQSIEEFIIQSSKNNGQLSDFFERFKEPIILPKSNIKNGLGFFGSYYTKTKKIIVN